MGFSVNTQLESRRSLEDRLLEKRHITPGGCWEWTKATTQHGYGRMSFRNHVHRVHRLAAYLWLGFDLSDSRTSVCHHCDNPPCFNPDHLYLGSQKTNVRDMVDRGRHYPGPEKWEACVKGHELTPETRVAGTGRCKICANQYNKSRYATCVVCGLEMLAQSVRRHMRNKHSVQAIADALGVETEGDEL